MNSGDSSPTSVEVLILPSANSTGPYTVTATPVGGGSPVTATCPTPACTLPSLTPGTTYDVTVTGINPATGTVTPASPAGSVTTPAAGSPAGDVQASSPTSAAVTIAPAPNTSGPYTVTAVPVGGGSAITVTCATADCPLTNLAPGTTYEVTVSCTDASGNPTPPSAADTITTPVSGWVPVRGGGCSREGRA